jgi:hypothetical protein
MIARGEKTIETRSWFTKYRGPLVICSSITGDRLAYRSGLGTGDELAGCTIAIATLADCRAMTRADEAAACCRWYNGAQAWILDNVEPLPAISVCGQLGIFPLECRELDEHFRLVGKK